MRDVTRAPSKGPKPGGIRHELWSGDRRRQNSFLCYVYGGEGMQRVLLFEEYCVFKIFKIFRFLPTADDTHTSTSQHEASRETQEQMSNLWTCHCRTSLALLRRPQQQSGCCSGYEPARGEAPGHYNNLSNLYATVSFREMSRAFPIKFTSRYT